MKDRTTAEQCRELANSANIRVKRLNSVLKSISKRASKGYRNDCFILTFMSNIHKLALKSKLRDLGFQANLSYYDKLSVRW